MRSARGNARTIDLIRGAWGPSRCDSKEVLAMKPCRITFVLLSIVLVASCSQNGATNPSAVGGVGGSVAQVTGQGNSPTEAVMQFGQADVGSPFPPVPGHDESAHAKDNIVPRTVTIRQGGTVTFNVPAAVHQVRIYKPGTDDEDINTSNLTTLAAFAGCAGNPIVNAPLVINDTNNLEAAIPVPCFTATSVTHTFTTPGKYLVICGFLPHFEVGMYGWVEVKES
jgi:plastocyanin